MIDTAPASASDDQAIQQRIENEAATTIGLSATKVIIAVENGYVVLYGTVDKYIQKINYERIAWKTDGVIEVDNEIRVVPVKPLIDIMAQVMAVTPSAPLPDGATLLADQMECSGERPA